MTSSRNFSRPLKSVPRLGSTSMRESVVRDVSPSDEGTRADSGETRFADSASSVKEDSALSLK